MLNIQDQYIKNIRYGITSIDTNMDLKRFITKQNDKKNLQNDQTQKDIKLFIENFCRQNVETGVGQSMDDSSLQQPKSSYARSRKRKTRTGGLFKRMPMFDEIQKLQNSNKLSDIANIQTVGWGQMAMNTNPLTGIYLGNPQSQAAKSRQHLKTANKSFHSKMKKEFETKDLYDLIFPKKEEHRCRKSIPVMRSRACGDGKCNDSVSNLGP